MTEIWKKWQDGYECNCGHNSIKYIEPIYISNLGNIQGRKSHINSHGYYQITYKGKNYKLHRLVAELFIPNPDNKREIDHINTIKSDNRAENLKWCNHKENLNNPLTIQRHRMRVSKKVKNIETGEIFDSAAEATRILNLPSGSVKHAANPKENQKTAGRLSLGVCL